MMKYTMSFNRCFYVHYPIAALHQQAFKLKDQSASRLDLTKVNLLKVMNTTSFQPLPLGGH